VLKNLLKHHEFWPPRLFELPFYFYLAALCLRYRLPVTALAKANYALDHGEIGIGSKFHTQSQFAQHCFPATQLLHEQLSPAQRLQQVEQFAEGHGWPLILKPDTGMVGKGILQLHSAEQAGQRIADIACNYLLQKFCDLPEEYGIFYVRLNGQSLLSGINQKHFPEVTGNGKSTLLQLARAHPRYSKHWATFLQYHELDTVPGKAETVRLSFIGSHTMGCMFTDDSDIATDALRQAVFAICDPQPGFNYGRLDVRAKSRKTLQAGEFAVIEINGVSSLPTHMFDPRYSLREAYRVFMQHGRYLVQVANEHRSRTMTLLPWWQVAAKVRRSQAALERQHCKLKETRPTI